MRKLPFFLILFLIVSLMVGLNPRVLEAQEFTEGWINRYAYDKDLGNGTHDTNYYIGTRVFWNNKTETWTELLLENHTDYVQPHYLLRNSHVSCRVGLYEGEDAVLYYDPDMNRKICAERWNIQAYILGSWVKLNKTFYSHSVFQNESFINVTGIFRTWYNTQSVGWLKISYILKPASYLKHDVAYRSTYSGSFEYQAVMTLIGIGGKRLVHNKGTILLNSTEIEGVWNRLSFRDSNNTYIQFLDENLDSLGHYVYVNGSEVWINDYLKYIRLKTVQYWGKNLVRCDIVIGNYTLGQNEFFQIDPATSTWNVTADADDRNVWELSNDHPPWSNLASVGQNGLRAGRYAGECHGSFMRWTGLNIASGSTINDAKFGKYCYDARTGDSDTRIYAVEDSGSPSAPTSIAEYNAQDYSEASVDWDYDWTVDGQWETSPNITNVVQEVVDQFTVTTFIILHEDRGGGSTSADDLANQYYRNTALTANLTITWTEVGAVTYNEWPDINVIFSLSNIRNIHLTLPFAINLRFLMSSTQLLYGLYEQFSNVNLRFIMSSSQLFYQLFRWNPSINLRLIMSSMTTLLGFNLVNPSIILRFALSSMTSSYYLFNQFPNINLRLIMSSTSQAIIGLFNVNPTINLRIILNSWNQLTAHYFLVSPIINLIFSLGSLSIIPTVYTINDAIMIGAIAFIIAICGVVIAITKRD